MHIARGTIRALAVVTAVCVMLASCSADKVEEDSKTKILSADHSATVLDHFKDSMTPDEVFADTADIDLNKIPDTSGLTEEVEKDDESATATYKYYDKNGALVYINYEGYGEDGFTYYTTSKSGMDLEIMYTDMNGRRYSVDIISDTYNLCYDEMTNDTPNVTLRIFDRADNDFDNSIEYTMVGESAYISDALYYSNDGYHHYTAWDDDGDGKKIDDSDEIIHKRADDCTPSENIYTMSKDYRVKSVEILSGAHKLQYSQNESGDKQWYIVCDVYFVFNDGAKAKSFGDDYGAKIGRDAVDDDYFVAVFKDSVMAVDPSFDIFTFEDGNHDEYSYEQIKFNTDGAIKDIDYYTSLLTYC